MTNNKPSLFRTIISMMISPASAVKTAVAGTKWYFSLAVSALGFGLFFLQTGLDLYKTGQKGIDFVWLSALSGLLYGIIIIPFLGALAWVILKLLKTEKDLKWAVSSFCLSYSGALVYGILGLLFSMLFGWKTSIAFGVTGVLWAIGPMIIAVREMTGGNNKISIIIVTIFSSIVLLSWSLFGQI